MVNIRNLIGNMKTKFMKVFIFKRNFFVQNLNTKIMKFKNFNNNFPYYIYRQVLLIVEAKGKIG